MSVHLIGKLLTHFTPVTSPIDRHTCTFVMKFSTFSLLAGECAHHGCVAPAVLLLRGQVLLQRRIRGLVAQHVQRRTAVVLRLPTSSQCSMSCICTWCLEQRAPCSLLHACY